MAELKISVVVPTCDRHELLQQAVRSALEQTVEVSEVIVVDDASGHDPEAVLKKFGPKVRLERLEEKGGANVARNRGIEMALGNLIAFLDDDDVWLTNKLELQIAAMGDSYEACLCTSREASGAPRPPKGWQEVREEHLKYRTPCGTSGLLATSEVLKSEKFDPAIPRGQDWDLFVRLVQRQPIAFVDQPLYIRQTGHDRITTLARDKTPEELLTRAAAVVKHRAWLGEEAYRQRIAGNLLAFITHRSGKMRYLQASLKHAGLRATVNHFAKTVRKKSEQRGTASKSRQP
ncbi:glycosyltransferase family 2 protein [Shimia sediminis]|uniref:glycosyltransferase family 2 protein n=1 Tax=Shimia sediminis TaxID=2497945 RepID=UPI000F8CD923|nr:glycosyltransferase family 2 protein [Shimia sediminis]